MKNHAQVCKTVEIKTKENHGKGVQNLADKTRENLANKTQENLAEVMHTNLAEVMHMNLAGVTPSEFKNKKQQ